MKTDSLECGRWKVCVSVTAIAAGISISTAFSVRAQQQTPAVTRVAEIEANSDLELTLGDVVVVARKREELVKDVPVAETVLSGAVLDRDDAVTLTDLAQKAPNLMVSATNSRQTSVAMRGLGKNSANEAIQSSVGIIVDGVPLTQAGMSWSDYVDLDHIEVLRGPQGTLQGKNTTLGVIVISTKTPSSTPEYTIEAGYGSRSTYDVRASATGPLVDELLAYRASYYTSNGDGPIKNIYTPLGGTWEGPRRGGARLQFLLTPMEDLTARLIINYDASDERGNLSPYILDPTTFAGGTVRTITYSSRLGRGYFGGYAPLIGPITSQYVDLNSAQPLPVHQRGLSLEVNGKFGGYTLTAISAYRRNDFNFRNDFDYTHFDIQQLSGTIGDTNQISQELRLASPVGPAIDYQVGLFAHRSKSFTLSRTLFGRDAGAFYATNSQYAALSSAALQASLNGVYNTTEVDPTSKSAAAFAQGNWHLTDKATLTAGLRDTEETVGTIYDKGSTGGAAVSGAALAIRSAQYGGPLYGYVNAGEMKNNSVSWLVNPSYKLTGDILLYAAASFGTKSGAVQLDSNGHQANVQPENSRDYELGFKSSWLNQSLIFDANLYQTHITNYQSTATVVSAASSTGYASLLTNVGGVLMRGLEFDSAWNATGRLHFTLGGAYNDAKYSSYTNATCPVELSVSTPCNFTGKQVAAAPKVSVTIGMDSKQPVGAGLVGHVFLNDVFRSRANLSTTLSEYTWQGAYNVTNGGIGLISLDGKIEIDFIAKNLLSTRYAINLGQYSNSAGVAEFYGDPRYVGFDVKARF
jgi:iron complex outermembrane receptor protein